MTLFTMAARNLRRDRARTALTVLAAAVAFVAFVLLRSVVHAWGAGVEYSAKDRLATRHRVSFIIPLPKRYLDDVKNNIPGVKAVASANWFGGRWPRDPNVFFANLAVGDGYFEAYPELQLDAAARESFRTQRQGAILGRALATRLGVKVGDRVTLKGTIFPGDWQFVVSGLYDLPPRSAIDPSQFLFHWSYLNDSIAPERRDTIGWIVTRVEGASAAERVTRAIDQLFETRDVQTLTMSEGAMNRSFVASISSILAAMNLGSLIILFVLTMLLSNTIAMNVRERTAEYGTLSALGFTPRHVRFLVLSESFLIAAVAGGLGIAMAYPIVELGVGRWLELNVPQFFPSFHLARETWLMVVGSVLLLAGLAGIVPALRASRASVVDALRRVA